MPEEEVSTGVSIYFEFVIVWLSKDLLILPTTAIFQQKLLFMQKSQDWVPASLPALWRPFQINFSCRFQRMGTGYWFTFIKNQTGSHKTFGSVTYPVNVKQKTESLKGYNIIKSISNGFSWKSSKIIIPEFQESVWSLAFLLLFFPWVTKSYWTLLRNKFLTVCKVGKTMMGTTFYLHLANRRPLLLCNQTQNIYK